MRAVLDTSVLIGAEDPGALEGAISAASLAELHFGVLVARDEDEHARRAVRLGVIESTFEPLPSTPRSPASGDAWPPPCVPAAPSRAAVPWTSRSPPPPTPTRFRCSFATGAIGGSSPTWSTHARRSRRGRSRRTHQTPHRPVTAVGARARARVKEALRLGRRSAVRADRPR